MVEFLVITPASKHLNTVIPDLIRNPGLYWTPAFAGVTNEEKVFFTYIVADLIIKLKLSLFKKDVKTGAGSLPPSLLTTSDSNLEGMRGLFLGLSTIQPEFLSRAKFLITLKSRPTQAFQIRLGECPASNQVNLLGRYRVGDCLLDNPKKRPLVPSCLKMLFYSISN